MLGPSFSPSMARMPGPTSSHSRYQPRLPSRARWTRERSCERTASSALSGGGGGATPRAWVSRAGRGSAASPPVISGSGRCEATGDLLELYAHGAGQLPAQRQLACPDADEHGPPEGLAAYHLNTVPEPHPQLDQVAQHLRIGVRHAHEAPAHAGLELVQAVGLRFRDLERGRGDGIAVRVEGRMAEAGGDERL